MSHPEVSPARLAEEPWKSAGLTRAEWEAMMEERYPSLEQGERVGPRPEAELLDDPRCWEKM